jgi:L-ascorbate metabolism protein UlaG (beta-lactamase superfamily)
MSKIAVTRITHSCHLIEIGGRTILTDPWFSTRPGYYQGEPIAVSIADLPRLDAVLISHEHYDHCDLETFAAYRDQSVPCSSPRRSSRPPASTASATSLPSSPGFAG